MDNLSQYLARQNDLVILRPCKKSTPNHTPANDDLTCACPSLLLALSSAFFDKLLVEDAVDLDQDVHGNKVVNLPFSFPVIRNVLQYIKAPLKESTGHDHDHACREFESDSDSADSADSANEDMLWEIKMDTLEASAFLGLNGLTTTLVKEIQDKWPRDFIHKMIDKLVYMERFDLAFASMISSHTFLDWTLVHWESCMKPADGLDTFISCVNFDDPVLLPQYVVPFFAGASQKLAPGMSTTEGTLKFIDLCEKSAILVSTKGDWTEDVHVLSEFNRTDVMTVIRVGQHLVVSYPCNIQSVAPEGYVEASDGSRTPLTFEVSAEELCFVSSLIPEETCAWGVSTSFGAEVLVQLIQDPKFFEVACRVLHPRYFTCVKAPSLQVMQHLLSVPWCYSMWSRNMLR